MKTRVIAAFVVLTLGLFHTANAEILKIDRVSMTVSDLEQTKLFFRDGLGFEKVSLSEIKESSFSHLFGVEGTTVKILTMRVGNSLVDFVQYSKPGLDYPRQSTSLDLWFQHIAIVVSDMEKAYAYLKKVKFEPISINGHRGNQASSKLHAIL